MTIVTGPLRLITAQLFRSRRFARAASLEYSFFFFNDTATTEIYTLSLHDALPIFRTKRRQFLDRRQAHVRYHVVFRSEEHTSELQSRGHLVCRLLLEKKKKPVTWRWLVRNKNMWRNINARYELF